MKSRRIVDRRGHRWLFEVEGGHGQTRLRTRRRIEDTRPSGVDPVNAPNVARGSQRVAQEKKSSRHCRHILSCHPLVWPTGLDEGLTGARESWKGKYKKPCRERQMDFISAILRWLPPAHSFLYVPIVPFLLLLWSVWLAGR